MSVDQAALANNKKLFDLYAKKLCSGDANSFIEIAEKLAIWLNNEKAYYDQARPEIVKLLLVAQSTLRRAVNADPATPFHLSRYTAHPFAPSYIKLINVVKRFMPLFIEPELEGPIRYLVNTVSNPLPLPPVMTQNLPTNQGQTNLPSPQVHQTSSSTMPSTSPIQTAPAESNPPATINSTPVPQKNVVQKVKRKRKPLDYLVDVDLRKFRETSTASQAQTVDGGEPTKQEVVDHPETDPHKVCISEPSDAILPPNLSRKSSLSVQVISSELPEVTSPVLKTVEEVKATGDHDLQKSYLPIAQVSQDGKDGPDVQAASTAQIAVEGTPRLNDDVADSTIQSLRTQDTMTAVVSEDSGHLEPTSVDKEPEVRFVSPPPVSTGHVASDTDMALSEPGDSTETPIVGVGDEVKASEDVNMTVTEEGNQDMIRERDQSLKTGDSQDQLPTQTTVLEKIEELHTKLSLCASQTPLDHGLKLPSVVENHLSNEEYLARPEIRSLLGLDDERNGVCTEVDATDERSEGFLVEVQKPFTKEDGIVHNLFERIKVPAFVKGLRNPGKVIINFTIKPTIHLALSRWTEKSCHNSSNFNDAMCITLGCYKATEAALSAIANNNEQSWKEFVSSTRSSWPKTGGLQLTLTAQQHYNLPLSPPIIVTPDGLLDISHLLIAGPNSFELRSNCDMSTYVFALVVHPPTPSQLALHYECCKKEQEWQKWITSLSRPFNVNQFSTFA